MSKGKGEPAIIVTDSMIAIAVLPIIERGIIALQTYILSLPLSEQPLGGIGSVDKMFVVTAHDFDTHAKLLRQHVIRNSVTLHVLCENGQLCALFEKRKVGW